MLNQEEIMINSFAQEIITLDEIIIWFENSTIEQQRDFINKASICLNQSRPSKEIIDNGIKSVPLKPTITPIVLFKTKDFKVALQKVLLLPENEYAKVFITLISLFKIADTERRNIWCKNGCNHQWHNLEKK